MLFGGLDLCAGACVFVGGVLVPFYEVFVVEELVGDVISVLEGVVVAVEGVVGGLWWECAGGD